MRAPCCWGLLKSAWQKRQKPTTETRRKEEEEEPAADTSFDTTEFGENISFDFGSNEEPEEMEAAQPEDESESVVSASGGTEAVEGFRAPGGVASIPEILKFLIDR